MSLAPPVVVIGRNEGERLRRSISSALRQSGCVVYVDSGSEDASCLLARSLGASVVELDRATPFTAARARNAGFQLVLGQCPVPDAVQFMDGDGEMAEGWLDCALGELNRSSDLGAVCGHRRERFAAASIYGRLYDLELDTPAGEVVYFGGDVLVRTAAFRAAGGFNAALIAGEEPELALRLRRNGWRILQLPAEMTVHESGVTRFGQWCRRAVRAGHAYAEGAWLHGLAPEHHWLRETMSIVFWGLCMPVLTISLLFVVPAAACAILAAYPLLLLRIYRYGRKRGWARRDALIYGWFCILGKFPQALGLLRFLAGQWSGRRRGIVEYKTT